MHRGCLSVDASDDDDEDASDDDAWILDDVFVEAYPRL